jgi:hypothetical protein
MKDQGTAMYCSVVTCSSNTITVFGWPGRRVRSTRVWSKGTHSLPAYQVSACVIQVCMPFLQIPANPPPPRKTCYLVVFKA